MIIRPDFYRPLNVDRRAEMLKLQLDPDRPTGIVMFRRSWIQGDGPYSRNVSTTRS